MSAEPERWARQHTIAFLWMLASVTASIAAIAAATALIALF